MALSTRVGIPPDENWHIGLIRLYTRDGIDPYIQNQEGYYFLGEVIRNTSFLYHYLLSFILRLADTLGLNEASIFLLRFINVGIGFLTLLVLWKLIDALRLPKLVRNLIIFMMSNTLMFVFLSASINYDNLLILLSMLSMLIFVYMLQSPTIRKGLLLLVVMTLAILTKYTFLPIAVLLILLLVIVHRSKINDIPKSISAAWVGDKKVIGALLIALLLLGFVGLERFGGNMLKYGKITPKCNQVLQVSQCEQNAIYQRSVEFSKLKPNPVSHFSTTEFTFNWFMSMQDRTFGVFAHKSFLPFEKLRSAFLLFSIITSCLVVRKLKKEDTELVALLFLAVTYTIVLWSVNRDSYNNHGIFGVALQGRYALPILFIPYTLGALYAWKTTGKHIILQGFFVCGIIIVFILSSLPSYILRTDSSWHTEPLKETNLQLKGAMKRIIP